ncbi:MFS transporter, PPP family, 3-phenylpropionic acid transporter [Lachnospiraceae bacterium NE2001]|nr:MFS transporter, PPP family, 3-phenylpropionic acid transporter [Lachnospiraceae bacterium NE2001]
MKSSVGWTIRYTLINVTYFVAFCTIHALAALYLLDRGFSNTEVGILLAVANILSAISQPIVAGIIDKPGPLTNRRFILISVMIIALGSILLMLFDDKKVLVFIVYVIIYMVQFTYQPVMTALCFEYQKAGYNIYYGLARGLGSASFAVTSAFVGGAVARRGVGLLLVINVVSMLLSAVIVYTFKMSDKKTEDGKKDVQNGADSDSVNERDIDSDEVAHNNLFDFIRTYPAFSLFLLGTICFFFAHNMINDFMIQIIRSLGGGEKELGYSNFLQAILELPVMAMIGIILKKITSNRLLIISGIAFFIKILILVFATNMVGMYVSQSFQLFAYAVFIPAAAYYVSSNMSELDQVKGQAFVTSAITIGGVFSNLISGVILDNLGIKQMLITGTVTALVGVVITIIAFKPKRSS